MKIANSCAHILADIYNTFGYIYILYATFDIYYYKWYGSLERDRCIRMCIYNGFAEIFSALKIVGN